MAKRRMSNAQAKRMLRSILSKTQRVWKWGFSHVGDSKGGMQVMTTKDMTTIENIIVKNLKKIR